MSKGKKKKEKEKEEMCRTHGVPLSYGKCDVCRAIERETGTNKYPR